MVVASENFDGKVFEYVAFWQILKFHAGTLAYYVP